MDDKQIIDLYWERSEKAISETSRKYGGYCYSIAYNILTNKEDAEESVNDTYLAAWNRIPPNRPSVLGTFLGRITRNISISRWRSRTAAKRGSGEFELALEELEECLAGGTDGEAEYIRNELARCINTFLGSLQREERNVFLRRYWFLDSIAQISWDFEMTQSKVKSMLFRTRQKLRRQLEREGLL